ncbi:MAG TPA: hypothetical protein VLX92_06395 [Kofleriaceae bacterium]|nr:hypothetical protein [Kofleriaceae bacterium]
MPATPAHADPCAVASAAGNDDASQAAALVEALRRRRGSELPSELASAQDSLERRIRAHLSRGRVSVTLTDNRYTMISVRRVAKERRYEVRLHHMFADADPVVTRALARYIADNDAEASRVLGEFIDQNAGHVRGRARRQPTQLIFTAGEHHDLRHIFDDLNARYFANKIDAAITWGARTGRPRRRNSIKMGSYSVEDRLIRIHRSLDRAFVPRFFVGWIVFHEMLHQVHDIRVKNGRREFHSKEFLADEAMYEHYDQAKTWERRHLDALLTY